MLQRLPNELWAYIIREVGIALALTKEYFTDRSLNPYQITDKRDLKNLSQVSKSFYDWTIPSLYHNVTIQAPDEQSLDTIPFSNLLFKSARIQDALRHATSLRIVAGFAQKLERRCLHQDADSDALDSQEDDKSSDFENLLDDLPALQYLANHSFRLLRCIPNGKLQSFMQVPCSPGFLKTWDLGVCVPVDLLDYDGYLPLHQRNIESLRLITDASCHSPGFSSQVHALDSFKCLRRFSWTGIRTRDDFTSLQNAFKSHSEHLIELELDFVNWQKLKEIWEDDYLIEEHPFEDLVLGVACKAAGLRFPALERLSLSNLDMMSGAQGIACAFATASLQSLTFHRCPGWDDFLHHLFQFVGNQLHLQTLEVQSNSYDDDELIKSIIETVVGVHSLYLSLWNPRCTRDLWNTLPRHQENLKQFIFQVTTVVEDDESEFFEQTADLGDMSFSANDASDWSQSNEYVDKDDEWFNDEFANPLGELELESIGLACAPRRLKEVLRPFADKTCLQLLHIRQSGECIGRFGSWAFDTNLADIDTDDYANLPPGKHATQSDGSIRWVTLPSLDDFVVERITTEVFNDFASWVFGPNGIKSLQLLVYGDFSCHGRYLDDMFMLQRRRAGRDGQTPFEWYDGKTERIPDIEELLDRHPGFLEACPTDTLLRG
ncbi:hypothetical protein BGZ63DRAFT_428841 [Mariannaea sp. PMI_226]|nr:hypothetical protein BGZ63DRAFT_428841 [Mariannaea sp. PMI_226]